MSPGWRRRAPGRPPTRGAGARHGRELHGERRSPCRARRSRRGSFRRVPATRPRQIARPRPRPAFARTAAGLLERLEHPLEVLGRDAAPRVDDVDARSISGTVVGLHAHQPPGACSAWRSMRRFQNTWRSRVPSPRTYGLTSASSTLERRARARRVRPRTCRSRGRAPRAGRPCSSARLELVALDARDVEEVVDQARLDGQVAADRVEGLPRARSQSPVSRSRRSSVSRIGVSGVRSSWLSTARKRSFASFARRAAASSCARRCALERRRAGAPRRRGAARGDRRAPRGRSAAPPRAGWKRLHVISTGTPRPPRGAARARSRTAAIGVAAAAAQVVEEAPPSCSAT